MPTVTNLNDLFCDMLRDIYYAEKKILKALPKMAKSINKSSELAMAFQKHREETEGQVKRLEQVFEIMGQKPKAKKCDAIEGLAKEADELIESVDCEATLEAGLLAGAQAVEHYEIARYGTLIEWAKLLGRDDAAKLLEQTIAEEKKTDATLNKMAQSAINQRALDAMATNESTNDNEHKTHLKKRAA